MTNGLGKKDLLRICSICKKINIEGNWVGEEDYPNYQRDIEEFKDDEKKGITDGYCPPCTQEELKKYGLKKEHENPKHLFCNSL